MKTLLAILLSLLISHCCLAAEPAATTPAPKPKATKPGGAKPATPKTDATAKPATAPKNTAAAKVVRPRTGLRTEAEISGFASETSDSYYGRVSLIHTSRKQNWWVKTAYRDTTSRNYGKKVTENNISGFDLDAYYRRNKNKTYSFASLVAGNRKRTPASAAYYDSSDFRMFSVGYGKSILPGLEVETAIAHVAREKGVADERIAPLYTIRVRKPVSTAVTMDADVHLIQPFSEDALVDSRMNLTYRFTPTLSMRLTYVANNVLGTTLTKREWDKLFRVSLVFSH